MKPLEARLAWKEGSFRGDWHTTGGPAPPIPPPPPPPMGVATPAPSSAAPKTPPKAYPPPSPPAPKVFIRPAKVAVMQSSAKAQPKQPVTPEEAFAKTPPKKKAGLHLYSCSVYL